MFRTKLTLVGLVVAAVFLGAMSHRAVAAHDSWYAYATSLTKEQQAVPFITDTLAPGGRAYLPSAYVPGGASPAVGQAIQKLGFGTDTLVPVGNNPQQSYRFITDTLAPGGGPSIVSAPASNGFDWGDFGIGAGAMAGIGALLLGSVRLLNRRNVLAV
jgi:hypothetical protein